MCYVCLYVYICLSVCATEFQRQREHMERTIQAMRRSVDQTEQLHERKEKRAQEENVVLLQYVYSFP